MNKPNTNTTSLSATPTLTGDYAGAIEDFRFYIEWGSQANRRPSEQLSQREEWIRDLEAGKNPFIDEELEKLRKE